MSDPTYLGRPAPTRIQCDVIKKHVNPRIRQVMQYSMDGKYIATFENIRVAAKELGITHGHISSAANGKQKYCSGFKWRYK